MTTAQLASNPVFQRWLDRARAKGDHAVLGEAKRQSQRIAWIAPAAIVFGESEPQRRIPIRVQDISREGIGVHCREAVPVLTPVRIYAGVPFSPDEFIDGTIVHCTLTVGGYKIGGQIDAGGFVGFPFPG